MPSPVGHALGGLIVGLLTRARLTDKPYPQYLPHQTHLTICAVAACLPDIDFLWGRHNMETHSLGFAVLVGLAAYAWQRSPRLGLACTLACASHVLFDWLGSDTTPPLGVVALWPLSNEFYFADVPVFQAISRRYWLPNFVTHNLLAVAREIAILLPIVAVVWWLRNPSRRVG